jgi:hypothetical protein
MYKFALISTIQIGHITCDNASNNSTMLQEVAARIKIATGKPYKWRKRKIKYVLFLYLMISATHVGNSCLAHVINLATQALIGTYSQSPYFEPKSPESHVPTCRDEVGLIRAIVVKVCHP